MGRLREKICTGIGASLLALVGSLAETVSASVSEGVCRDAAVIVVGEVIKVDSRVDEAPGMQGTASVELSVSEVLTGPAVSSVTIVVATTDGSANDSSVQACLKVGYRGIFLLAPVSPASSERLFWKFVQRNNEILPSALLESSAKMRQRVLEVIRSQALDGSVYIAGAVNILGRYRRVSDSDGLRLNDLLQDSGGFIDFAWRVFVVGGQTGRTVSFDVFGMKNLGRLRVKNSPVSRGSVVYAVHTAHRL